MDNEKTKIKKLGIKEIRRIDQKDVLDAIDEYKQNISFRIEAERKHESKRYPICEIHNPNKKYPSKYIAMLAYNKIVYGEYIGNNGRGIVTENFYGGFGYSGIARYFKELLIGTNYIICEDKKKLNTIISRDNLFPDDITTKCIEGAKKNVIVNKYERDEKARLICIKKHGLNCKVCGVLLKDIYGDIAEGFIHVHHIIPLKKIDKEYVVDPEKDLLPVCPNCHAMLHRTIDKQENSIDNLRKIVQQNLSAANEEE